VSGYWAVPRDQYLEVGICDRCGRATNRWVHRYTLGRADSPPVRAFDRWRHIDDGTLACDEEAAV